MVVGIIILVVITMNSGNQSVDTSLDLSFGLIIKYLVVRVLQAQCYYLVFPDRLCY